MTQGAHNTGSADKVWTISTLLASMQTYLQKHQVPGARLDAEVLLSFVLKVDRIYLYTHFDQPITAAERDILRALVVRRAAREPIAYICGRKEFFSRDFKVDANVLVPRPETEHVIETVLAWAGALRERPLRVLDVGTGSGILAITLACELPEAQVWATDISSEALAIARVNAESLGVLNRITFAEGDLFAALGDVEAPFDIIVSNPPYIAKTIASSLSADILRYEPQVALFGGDDGLAVLRRFCAQVRPHTAAQSCVAIEIGYDQSEAVRDLLGRQAFDEVDVVCDLQGHARVVTGVRGPRPSAKITAHDAPDDQRDDHGLFADDTLPVFDADVAPDGPRAL